MSDLHTAKTLMRILNNHGECYIVGGYVRDHVMGVRQSNDIDISTSLTPEEITDLGREYNFTVHPTGIAYGVVTVVIDGCAFEVTTYRQDVNADGRRCGVTYSDNPFEDSFRRDFTMNALYMRDNGQFLDFHGGIEDIRKNTIKFVGNMEDRIREDYLRVMRYIRFSSTYGLPIDFDDTVKSMVAILVDIGSNRVRELLSKERVDYEMRKIFKSKYLDRVLKVMNDTGLFRIIYRTDANMEMYETLTCDGQRFPYHVEMMALFSYSTIKMSDRFLFKTEENKELKLLNIYIHHTQNVEEKNILAYYRLDKMMYIAYCKFKGQRVHEFLPEADFTVKDIISEGFTSREIRNEYDRRLIQLGTHYVNNI